MTNFTFPTLPVPGELTEKQALVLQVFADRYETAKTEAQQVLQFFQYSLNEYKDVDSDGLEPNEIAKIIKLESEGDVRKYIADKQIKKSGVVMLGGLKLSPDALAGMLATEDVRQIVLANKHSQQAIYVARSNWRKEDFIIVNGKVEIKEEAVNRVVNSCIVTGKGKRSKDLFRLVGLLANLQNEINANYKGFYPIQLDELLTVDNTGNIIPFGGKILQRTNELE